jgi:hypothetical protein
MLNTLAVSSLFGKAALRRLICPRILSSFLPTVLNLKPVAFCASSFCRSLSVEATVDDDAWPRRPLRVLPAIHLTFVFYLFVGLKNSFFQQSTSFPVMKNVSVIHMQSVLQRKGKWNETPTSISASAPVNTR